MAGDKETPRSPGKDHEKPNGLDYLEARRYRSSEQALKA
jgi:hypothetical protein